jgi:hypothetical protein
MSSNRQAALHSMLQELKLTTMATACAELALRAAKEGLSHEAFLYELARVECEGRTQRRIERRLTQSGLPREKTFATFQVERLSPALRLQLERLRSGAFVEEAANVVVVGPPGVGKSHAMAALGQALIRPRAQCLVDLDGHPSATAPGRQTRSAPAAGVGETGPHRLPDSGRYWVRPAVPRGDGGGLYLDFPNAMNTARLLLPRTWSFRPGTRFSKIR